MIGQTISHYRIVEKLGEGGMGVVYKAQDTTLERTVALKFLASHLVSNEDVRKRFLREAKTAAVLQHPNICTVHEIAEAKGHTFIAMACLEGRELTAEIAEGPLEVDRVLDLAIQFADGLAEAHGKGIVHRDVKPPNLFVTSAGRGLVLDFGLAQLAATRSKLTREGTTLGTCLYMSPEQATGEEIDARTDVWAMGCVLYEMLMGRSPFRSDYEQAIVYAILNETPTAISEHRQDVPIRLEQFIAGCLAKRAADRPSSGAELASGLRAIKRELASNGNRQPSGQQDAIPSVAVLPFQNRGRDEEDEYLSDGLAEEVINALTKLEGVRVAARSSSFYFKGKSVPLEEVAAKLHVGTVVEGTLRRAGDRLRITVQLVDVESGFQVWSERYDRVMADIFDIQDEISLAIVSQLKVRLIGDESLVTRPTANDEAYNLYLKGRHYWHQRSPSTLPLAIQCFEEVIRLDPEFALAYAGLADCHGIFRVYGWKSAREGREPARTAVEKAAALAPSLWEVSFSRGFYQFYFERDWRAAEPHFLRAVSLNSQSSLAQVYCGMFFATLGRADEASEQARLARELDPLSPLIHSLSCATLMMSGRFDDGEQAARRALELQPDYLLALWARGASLSALGRHEEAIADFERAVTMSRTPIFVGLLGLGYARGGRLDDAKRLLRELEERASRGEYVQPATRLSIFVGLGDTAGMARELSSAIADDTPPLSILATSGPLLKEFRDDPEIDGLLSQHYGV